ncbi:putative formamidopyrimidine-DNA glycosylase [Actinacidiphila reveromycinica]|uniref:Putative formamidopyrimidine-DNA glycosylase n=1 Tax=Actinacidiphila reveromycinica TaxID=659352 RepID=A0A7U3VLD6_9ACTN|nr:DNA-formamidopyrimidine glycosylase family protein [Streptomyces sp. SN-593]BBA95428.1 putative formamidopyrimidine-DNA glycosylase [Streptomyces sp. SN-593]
MPELPDVEGFRRVLRSNGRGRRIEKVEVRDSGVLRGVSARRLRRALEGHRFLEPERRGKWLVARTDGGAAVLLHFGMTGELVACPPGEPPHRHDRVRFDLSGGRGVRFRDQRKLQGLRLAASDAGVERALGGQGPDAAAVGEGTLRELLRRRRATAKSVLMDQSALAGLGNLLVDEILWRAHLHPSRPANSLTRGECRRIHTAMTRVLDQSVRAGRVPGRPTWLTGHRGQTPPTCPRGHARLHRDRIAGRTTFWCPRCQPPPEPADG